LRDLSLFAVSVAQLNGREVGTHTKQYVLAEWLLQDQTLEHAFCWMLEESCSWTSKSLGERNLRKFLLSIGGVKNRRASGVA
jgi:hypothetical protein